MPRCRSQDIIVMWHIANREETLLVSLSRTFGAIFSRAIQHHSLYAFNYWKQYAHPHHNMTLKQLVLVVFLFSEPYYFRDNACHDMHYTIQLLSVCFLNCVHPVTLSSPVTMATLLVLDKDWLPRPSATKKMLLCFPVLPCWDVEDGVIISCWLQCIKIRKRNGTQGSKTNTYNGMDFTMRIDTFTSGTLGQFWWLLRGNIPYIRQRNW